MIGNEQRAIKKISENGGHINIVTILVHGWFISDQFYFIDMELCYFSLRGFLSSGLRLHEPLKSVFYVGNDSMWELFLWNIFSQIARGLEFIHSKGETHRDIKSENDICNIHHFCVFVKK
jgi:serine/threonine protein kinase